MGNKWVDAIIERDEVYDQWARIHCSVDTWEQLTPEQVKEMKEEVV